jgi:uncharacterized protein YegP (UPF0339 family)
MRVIRPAKFECVQNGYDAVWRDGATNGWYFRVIASNGKILCHSETYNTRRACLKAIAAVQGAKKVVEL